MGETFLRRHLPNEAVPLDDAVFDRLLVGNFIPTSTVMLRRSAVIDVGGYDESLSYDDYDMWLRLSHRFRFSYCDGLVANYRVVTSSMVHSATWRPLMIRSTITIIERWAAVDEVREVPSRRQAVAYHLRRLAKRIAHHDARRAYGALQTAEELLPSLKWRLIYRLRVFSLPGGPRLVEGLSGWSSARRSSKLEVTA